jgi:hypothetical protein
MEAFGLKAATGCSSIEEQASVRCMTRNDQLLNRLREIGYGSGDLDIRVRAARTAIQDERSRFSASDAGRMQWNWYIRQLAADIGLERHRLARSAHKPARPGRPTPGPLLTLLNNLWPRILDLQENV